MTWARGDNDSSVRRLLELLKERLRICRFGKGKEVEGSDGHGAKLKSRCYLN